MWHPDKGLPAFRCFRIVNRSQFFKQNKTVYRNVKLMIIQAKKEFCLNKEGLNRQLGPERTGWTKKIGCAPAIEFFSEIQPLYTRPDTVPDTDRIIYRCFLPDLTRFMTVCCGVAGQNNRHVFSSKPLSGNSAPHKADFGIRAPLAPRLAQPL